MKLAALTLLIGLALIPQHVGINTLSTTVTNVLGQGDISFDGYIRVPSGGQTNAAQGTITGRTVAGHPHLLLWKSWATTGPSTPFTGVIEIDVNGLTPTPTLTASTPRATLYADWGDVSHGNVQSWDASCNPLIPAPSHVIPGGLAIEPGTNNLLSSFIDFYSGNDLYNVLLTSLDSVTGTTGSDTFIGGPWQFQATAQYTFAPRNGTRSIWFAANPFDGTMLVGGYGYGDLYRDWGPNLYGGRVFPTASDPGGCHSTPIVQTKEYLDYYSPDAGSVPTPNYFDGWTGQPMDSTTHTATTTIAQLTFPSSFISYPYLELPGVEGFRVNPTLYGKGSIGDGTTTAEGYVGWFNGTYKHGVIFIAGIDASDNGQTDPTQCDGSSTPAALESYLNAGTGWVHFPSYTGSWNPFDSIHGATSGGTAIITQGTSITLHNVVGWSNITGATDFLVGEVITDTTTGGVGTVDQYHRRNTFVGGCTCTQPPQLCATGPSTTWQVPVLMIYDPAALALVATGAATDYLTLPSTYIDLLQSPYSMTDIHHNSPVAPGVGAAGGWIDAANDKMYIVFRQNDRTNSLIEDAIARFSINDAPAPVPLPVGLSWRMPQHLLDLAKWLHLSGSSLEAR